MHQYFLQKKGSEIVHFLLRFLTLFFSQTTTCSFRSLFFILYTTTLHQNHALNMQRAERLDVFLLAGYRERVHGTLFAISRWEYVNGFCFFSVNYLIAGHIFSNNTYVFIPS